jgi:2-C-methyl-D-erythritol 4-phosphate cytidylyltransferase/2-C-methyl-D-erythritol 2,4-cyclodiphosphate synthase
VDRVLDAAEAHGASLLARRLPDTLKREGPGGDGFVAGTLPRNGLWLAQTPQAFRRDILEEALRAGDPKAATDEASLAEALGARVALVPGDAWNVKITDPADLAMAEALLLARGAPGWPCQAQPQAPPQGPPQAPPLPSPRGNPRGLGGPAKGSGLSVGQGWDFHRFAPGRELWLGCVRFEGCPGLEGHSDADVLTHALIDAILGAASLGDIGSHFPAGSEAFRGAPGRELLGLAWAKARDAFRIEHLDLTLFGESPRVAPRREEIRAAIASILGIPETKVNVKGKTTEGMGFLGRGEGLAASAAALLSRIPESGQG